jgi:D-beta-D-heptose 7-phosphate kinase/D-beta-D-heptose 1-phosphate adenosyltransferase
VLALEALLRTLERLRPARVALTNGCFDLLHLGHIRSLEHAASLADVLVVGLNSDESVRALKGQARPLLPADERAEIIAALNCVDLVTVFPELTAEALVGAVKPDVYVKGGEYSDASLPEAAIVRSYGGELVLAPMIPGLSTTSIVDRIRSAL